MPHYSYVCDACEHTLELYQGILEEKLQKCPECGGLTLRREIGKGSGIKFNAPDFAERDIHGRVWRK